MRILEGYDKESAAVQATNVYAMKKLGEELGSNKYENQNTVEQREKHVAEKFVLLTKLSAAKMPVLQDDLAVCYLVPLFSLFRERYISRRLDCCSKSIQRRMTQSANGLQILVPILLTVRRCTL